MDLNIIAKKYKVLGSKICLSSFQSQKRKYLNNLLFYYKLVVVLALNCIIQMK